MEAVSPLCDECHGVDVNREAFLEAETRHREFHLGVIGQDGKTDYPDEYFDTIAIIEVIEHVPDESRTLAELARILRPGGKLILTTPHKGLLTFLDVGNVKFVFPTFHRFVHQVLLRSRSYYQQRFLETRELNLVGDVSIPDHRRPWHRHYTRKQIETFCPLSLVLKKSGVFFPGLRLFMLLRQMLRVGCLGLGSPFPPPLSTIERRLSRVESKTGDQLVMLFEKRPEQNRNACRNGDVDE